MITTKQGALAGVRKKTWTAVAVSGGGYNGQDKIGGRKEAFKNRKENRMQNM